MMTTQERIIRALEKNPNRTDIVIAKNIRGCNVAMVANARTKMLSKPLNGSGDTRVKDAPVNGGISLSRLRVLSRRPAESAAKFIKRLPKGRGFHISVLSKEWGMSEESIRRHARDLSCIKFVEIEEDEWVQLIMHPETANNYAL